jgi:hypothetical protein
VSLSLERALRTHLQDYLSGTIDLDQFKSWLIAVTWPVDPEVEPMAMSLAYEIQMALADYSSEDATESELRETLLTLLPQDQLTLSRSGSRQ